MTDIDDNLIFDDDEIAMLSQEFLDNPEYSRAARHLIFVYGTMRRGCVNHDRLHQEKTTKYLGEYRTVDWNHSITLIRRPNDKIVPAVISRGWADHFIVKGELYEISGVTLATLDLCEGHPNVYRRRFLELQKIKSRKTAIAQMYGYDHPIHPSEIVVDGKEIIRIGSGLVTNYGSKKSIQEYLPTGTDTQCKKCER